MKNNFIRAFSEIINDAITSDAFYSTHRTRYINRYLKDMEELYFIYQQLCDSESKECLIKLIKSNMMASISGLEKGYYTFYTKQEWENFIKESTYFSRHMPEDYPLDRIETFILNGYSYKNVCVADKGDYVLDCGSFTGNTCLFFSSLVGEYGRVFCFEPMPTTFNILKSNIINMNLKNCLCYNLGIDSNSGVTSFTSTANAGSRMAIGDNTIKVNTVSIDDFCKKNKIEKINFIKMDIEGAEEAAIIGAKNTIHKFHPKLAICVYHRPKDLLEIPKQILSINKNYKFYMRHNSFNFNETVLFAVHSDNKNLYTGNIDSNDLCILNNLACIYNNFYTKKQRFLREIKLKEIIKELTNITQYKNILYNKYYRYCIIPVSKDNNIHYEFLISDKIHIGLHFEGNYRNLGEFIDAPFTFIKRYNEQKQRYEIFQEIEFSTSSESIAHKMNYLIYKTYP